MIKYDGKFTVARGKAKRLYNVYKYETHCYNGMGVDWAGRVLVGQTMAVSAAQAENNVAHRMGAKVYEIVPWWGDGCRITRFVAEVAENDNSGGHKATGGKT